MKCPICGCKMKKEIVCPYCKITGDEVRFASNVEAKKRIKAKDTKEVYNSTYIPFDVNRKKLFFITLFGGLFGLDAIYVGRYKRGIIQFSILFLAFICFCMYVLYGYVFMYYPTEILTFICAFFMVAWLSNIFRILFNRFNVPVVLPTNEELKERIIAKQEEDKLKEEKIKAKKEAKYNRMVEREKRNFEKKEKEQKNKKDE